MKRAIVAGKQVGDVCYMCESLFAVYNILKSGEIKMTSKKEKSQRTGKPEYFTSLTRNFKALVAQNPARWRDGIILDGDKLSDTYAFDAINFAGYSMENQTAPRGGKFKIKQITKWPSRCQVRLVGWAKEITVSNKAYEDIRDACFNEISEVDKQKCRMEIKEGRRPVNGEIFIERILFNTPGGAPTNLFQYLNDSTKAEISQATNQYEERIHGPKSKQENSASRFTSRNAESLPYPVVHIQDCVKGIVINSEDEAEYPEIVESIEDVLSSQYGLDDYACIEYN